MKKREANFSTRLRSWLRANPLRFTCHLEVKQTTKDSIPFSCVEPQQVDYCTAVHTGDKGVLMRNMGGNGEPDYSYLYRDPVYIIIKYPKFFCMVSLQNFLQEKAISKRKSLSALRAAEIAEMVVDL